jgi:hypothetical protein
MNDIESLNLDALDVEELEHRLELASASPVSECYINCGCDDYGNTGGGGGGGCGLDNISVP